MEARDTGVSFRHDFELDECFAKKRVTSLWARNGSAPELAS